MKRHIKTVHQNLKPFSCQECEKTFGLKCDMKKHKKNIHLKLKTHVCFDCKATFGKISQLQRHTKNVHVLKDLTEKLMMK